MKNNYKLVLITFLLCLALVTKAKSQYINHEWIEFTEWDSIWEGGIVSSLLLDNEGKPYFYFSYSSYNDMQWFGHTFSGGNPNNCLYPAWNPPNYDCYIPYIYHIIKVNPDGNFYMEYNVV